MNFRREFRVFKQFTENNLSLHQKWPHDGPHDGPHDEVHGHGLIVTDEALGGVFVRLAERGTCPRNEEIVLGIVYIQEDNDDV